MGNNKEILQYFNHDGDSFCKLFVSASHIFFAVVVTLWARISAIKNKKLANRVYPKYLQNNVTSKLKRPKKESANLVLNSYW